MKKIAIIGGGIAGLYAAYKLHIRDMEIHIYEANNYWGGRIKTVKYDNSIMDTGAARYNMNHKFLVSLINDLGLSKYQVPIPNKKIYIKDGKTKRFNTDKYIKQVVSYSSQPSPVNTYNITMEQYMKQVLPFESIVDDIIYSFGYGVEFENMNASKSINLFQHDFLDDIQYYILNGGLSVLVNKLVYTLKAKGVHMHLNTPISNMKDKGGHVIVSHSDNEHVFDHCIICTTKAGLENIISDIDTNRYFFNIGQGALCRIFAKFDKGDNNKVWFDGMTKITTNNMLRYIIPLDYESGLIMISYTDGRYADTWNNIPTKELESVILNYLRKLFPDLTIPAPKWIKKYYWTEGMHYWKPGKSITTKSIGNNVSICGEIVSDDNHGWIEGALDSVEKCRFIKEVCS